MSGIHTIRRLLLLGAMVGSALHGSVAFAQAAPTCSRQGFFCPGVEDKLCPTDMKCSYGAFPSCTGTCTKVPVWSPCNTNDDCGRGQTCRPNPYKPAEKVCGPPYTIQCQRKLLAVCPGQEPVPCPDNLRCTHPDANTCGGLCVQVPLKANCNDDRDCGEGQVCQRQGGQGRCVEACKVAGGACARTNDCCQTPVRLTCQNRVCATPPPPPPPTPRCTDNGICLLEPIGQVRTIPTTGVQGQYLNVLITYFNLLYPWVIGLGAAIAVFMGLIGGIQVMQAGSDSGKRSAGTQRFLISLGGLILLLLSSTVLRVLNPSFYL